MEDKSHPIDPSLLGDYPAEDDHELRGASAPRHHAAMLNIAPEMKQLAHGTHLKDMFVCHESVSYNRVGWGDINGLIDVLVREGYGIHGINDKDGHKAWAKGMGNAIFWHAGGVNERAVGVECVSEIPILLQSKKITRRQALDLWLSRHAQLSALAIQIACWHNSDQKRHPLVRSNGNERGITSHWNVSQHHPQSDGHWNCRPWDEGGHFPLAHVIELSKQMALLYEF